MTEVLSPVLVKSAMSLELSPKQNLLQTIQGTANNYTLIRWLLAASVIYYHSFGMGAALGHSDKLTGALQPITTVGGLAVECFFFLSGLFVSLSFFRDQSTVGFCIKRTLRIWPGLFVCLVVTAVAAGIACRPTDAWWFLLQPSFYDYITSNARLKLTWEIPYIFSTNRFQAINGSIHTLPLEVKMYLLLAALGLLGLVRRRATLLIATGLLLAVVLFKPTVFTRPFDVINYGQAPIAMFFCGVMMFCVADRVVIASWQDLLLAVLFGLSTGPVHTVSFYLLVIWVLLWLGNWQPLIAAFKPKQDLSYGIYIYGWPCQQLVMLSKPDLNPYWLTAIALATAWLFALLSWRWVEQPAIEFGRQLTKRYSAYRLATPPSRQGMPLRWKPIAGLLAFLLVLYAAAFVMQRVDFLPVETMATTIVDFGPRESNVGQPINPQPNGESGIWLVLNSTPDRATRVMCNGRVLDSVVGDKLITAKVPASLLAKPGTKIFELERRYLDRIERSNQVELLVKR